MRHGRIPLFTVVAVGLSSNCRQLLSGELTQLKGKIRVVIDKMMPAEPRVGQLYSCAEQSRMHGGDLRSTLPDSEGRVTLIRFRLDRNPDGPRIIDHGPPKNPGSRTPERVEMLRCQNEPLPVYRYSWGGAWEYLGRYRVQAITEGGREAAERSKIRGRPTRYVIRLEEAD